MGFFWLVLRSFFQSAPNIINKSLEIFEIFLKKSFEYKLYNRSNVLVVLLMFGPPEVDSTTKKWSSKWDTIYFSSSKYLKIFFTLLTKMIIVYIRFCQICFRRYNIKKTLWETCLCRSTLQKCFHKLLENVIDWKKNNRWSRNLRKGKNLVATSMKFFCLTLTTGKFIMLSKQIGQKINKVTLLNIRS